MADVRFLGKPDIVGIGKTAPPASTEEWKRVALLGYLCLNLPLRLHTDTALASLLWPEVNPALGKRRVEKAVQWLDSFGPETLVDATRFGEYQVLQTTLSVDVWAFRGGVRMKRYEDALTLCGGVLMEGVAFTDAPDFMDWLGRRRVRYARLASLCAWRSYERALANGDRSLASGLLLLAYERSPVPKPKIARVMGLLASAGAPEEALRLFEREPEPPEEAKQLALALDPTTQPEKPQGRHGLFAGVVGLAVLGVLAVFALPDRRADPAPSAESIPAAESTTEEAVAGRVSDSVSGGPVDPALIWGLANQHLEARNYRQSQTLFRLLSEDPEFGERARARSSLATIYLALSANDPVSLYDLVQQAPPDVFHITEGPLHRSQFLGWIVAPHDSMLARLHFQEAKEEAERGIAEGGGDPWTYRNLALAELGLNNREQASNALDRAEVLADSAGSPLLRVRLLEAKLLEARAMLADPGSGERRTLLETFDSAGYPGRPDSTQLAVDPRWR